LKLLHGNFWFKVTVDCYQENDRGVDKIIDCNALLLVHVRVGSGPVVQLTRQARNLSNPGLDPRDKNCVTESGQIGSGDVYTARHCWSKGKLVLKSEARNQPLYNDKGELQCYQLVETEYRGRKKRTRTSCTKE